MTEPKRFWGKGAATVRYMKAEERIAALEARVLELEAMLEDLRRRFFKARAALRGETTGGE